MYDPFGPSGDDTDDSWIESLSFQDILALSEDTTGLTEWADKATPSVATGVDAADVWGPDQPTSDDNTIGDNAIGGRTSGRGSASAGANGSGTDDGGSIFAGLETFTRENKNLIGLGASGLAMWAKTISDNRNASQAADAAEMQRQQKEQDYADALALKREQDAAAIARADAKDKLDWERKQQLLQEQRDYEREVAKQKQADAMAQLAYSRSSSGGGGGGGGFDPAAARAARISASLVGQKAPTTGIVNSNIWGNAMNTLQKR